MTQTRVNNATSLHIQTSYALLKPKQGVILFTPDTILCLESGVNTSWHIPKHMAWCRLFISVCFVPTSSGIQSWTVFRCQQSGLFYILLVMNFKVQWQKHLFPIRLIHPYFFSFTAVRPAGFAELLFFKSQIQFFRSKSDPLSYRTARRDASSAVGARLLISSLAPTLPTTPLHAFVVKIHFCGPNFS